MVIIISQPAHSMFPQSKHPTPHPGCDDLYLITLIQPPYQGTPSQYTHSHTKPVVVRMSKFQRSLTFLVQNDIEDQDQITPYTIPPDILQEYTTKPNMNILGFFLVFAWTCHVHRGTDGRTDRPEA